MVRSLLAPALLLLCACASGALQDDQIRYLKQEGQQAGYAISSGLGDLAMSVVWMIPPLDPTQPASVVADEIFSSAQPQCGQPSHSPGSTQIFRLRNCREGWYLEEDVLVSRLPSGTLVIELTPSGEEESAQPGRSTTLLVDDSGTTVSSLSVGSTFYGNIEAGPNGEDFLLNGAGLLSQDGVDLAYGVSNLNISFHYSTLGVITIGPRPVLVRSDEARQYEETVTYEGSGPSVSVSEVGN